MTTISQNSDLYTLINVYTVTPERQQQLVEALIEVTERIVKHRSGFVSASFHKSLDGTRVIHYAQWENRETFEALIQNPSFRERMARVNWLGQSDSHIYTIPFISKPSETRIARQELID